MPGRLPYTTDLVIRNDVAELATLRDALDRVGVECGIPAPPLLQLQVVLDEMVSNVIKYAWPDGGAHEVRVRITVRAHGIDVEVVDDGQTFDPRLAPPPAQPPAGRRPRPGGVGIHMVKQLVDGYDYARIDGRNHLTLTKRCAVGDTDRWEERNMAEGALKVAETRSGQVCIVAVSGRIDSTNANDLLARLNRLLSSGEKTVLLDLQEVLYLTSAAFRVLLVATDEAERNAARLVLCSVLGQVRELFEMGGLLDAFTILGSREEAVAALA